MTTGPLVPENELTVVKRGSVEPRQAQYHRRSLVNVSLGETEDAPTKLLSGSGFFVIGNLAPLPAMFHLPLKRRGRCHYLFFFRTSEALSRPAPGFERPLVTPKSGTNSSKETTFSFDLSTQKAFSWLGCSCRRRSS